jgi:RNA polymerase sigma-70 factor (ECF subfamily)
VPSWHDGRDAIVWAMERTLAPDAPEHMGRWRLLPFGVNLQPAAAAYLKRPGDSVYRAFALDVLRVEDGRVAEITAFLQPEFAGDEPLDFGCDLFAAFGLPATV